MSLYRRFWLYVAQKVRPFFDVDMNGKKISGLPDPTEDSQAATKGYADDKVGGDMLKATYDPGENDVVDNAEKLEGSSKAQVQDHSVKDDALSAHSDPTNDVNMGGKKITHIGEPVQDQDIATKAYADALLGVTPADRPMIAWPTSITKCTPAGLKVFTDLGINALMCYDHWWSAGFTDNPAYITQLNTWFDNAAAARVKLYIFMDGYACAYKDNGNDVYCLSADDQKPFITKFKDKPAIAGWFIADEPHCWHTWEGYTIPEEGEQYYPYLTTPEQRTWPAGGHGLARMLYDMIRGQDMLVGSHPAFAVWDRGFMHKCEGPEGPWTSTYNTIYTPGREILDIGSVDIYPNGNNWDFLDEWIAYSHTFPYGNEDGFGELGKGMIPVIDAWTEGAADAEEEDGNCNLVNQCIHWENKYTLDKIKGIGFYTPQTFLKDDPDFPTRGSNLRAQIKEVCRRYGWSG